LGLGLALVRELVQLHGGAVHATSPGLGKGSTFVVELPAAGDALQSAAVRTAARPSETPPLRGVRVLVVEDLDDARELLSTILVNCGARVRSLGSATEAIDSIRDCDPSDRPHVVVSNIGPTREEGFHLIRQLRALPPEVGGTLPAVAVTGYAAPDDRARVLAAGYQRHVPKPVDPHVLATAVSQVIRPADV
jgi:CheY-like chemotaxis protein